MIRNILVTGITGNLGAFAVRKFLHEGSRVYAIVRERNKFKIPIEKRVSNSMMSFGSFSQEIEYALQSKKLILINADITSEDQISSIQIADEVDETWHFASSLKFMPKDRDEIHNVNINALQNIIKLHMRKSKKESRFYYISTAYIGGISKVSVKEEPIAIIEDMAFNNEYERSKLMAENIVINSIKNGDIKGIILRPSIVVGDKNNGNLINYHGYYLGINAFIKFHEHLENINEKTKYFRITANKDGMLNLIHIDDAIDIMFKIRAKKVLNGQIFNVVNGCEVSIQQVFDVIGKQLGLEFIIGDNDEFIDIQKSNLEKMLSYGMTYVMPYINNKIIFEQGNTARAIEYEYKYDFYPDGLVKLNKRFIELN